MLKLLPICLLVVVVSCENEQRDIPSGTSSRSLASISRFQDKAEFVDSFNRYHFKYKNNFIDINTITIKMVTAIPGTSSLIGYCDPNTKVITLEEEYWNYASQSEKEALVYHELGHCFLNRSHQSAKINGIAVSYMYPNISFDSYYDFYKEAYVEELFTGNLSKIKTVLNNETRVSSSATSEDEKLIHTCGTNDI